MNDKPTPKLLAFLLPTFSNMLWIAAFFGALFSGQNMMNADGDLGRHLTIGGFILDHRTIPLRDMFSHTMTGQPVTPHEWLTQVIFALVEQPFGFNGVILLCALVIATALWLVDKRIRRENKGLIVPVVIIGLTIITTKLHWLARPHIFTFLLLAAWMILLDQLRQGKLHLWWVLPALMVLWANLHGAFIAGFVSWFLYGVGIAWDDYWKRIPEEMALPARFWRTYILGGAAAAGASLLNPSGIGLWLTSFGYIGNKYLVSRTLEYWSPNFHQPMFWPFLIMIGLTVILLGLSKSKIAARHLFTTAAWLVMGLYSARNIPLFAIVAAPLLVQGLDGLFTHAAGRVKLIDRLSQLDIRLQAVDGQLNGHIWPVLCILLVIIGLGLGLRFDIQGVGYGFEPEVFPVAAVDWLEDNPQDGEMFNYFPWGGYLLYRGWPDLQVFIDGQTDFYGEALTRQYAQVILAEEGWEDVLQEYGVDWAILPPGSLAAREIQRGLGWVVVYEDKTAVILRQ